MPSAAHQPAWISEETASSEVLSSTYSPTFGVQRKTFAAAAPLVGVFLLLALVSAVQLLRYPELVAEIFGHL